MTNEILIITTVADVATDEVIRHLRSHDSHIIRVNTEDYPFDKSITLDYGLSSTPNLLIDGRLVQPHTIWHRRVRSPAKPEGMDAGIYDFCLRENRAGFIGSLLTQSARWLNHPMAVWQAEYKPYQLKVARQVDLAIPKTIISNEPTHILDAYEKFDSMIVKPARSGHFWQGGEEHSVYTSEVTRSTLASIDQARWTTSIYQERVAKQYDLRVTYVGGRIFAVAIDSQSDPQAAVDWRKTANPALGHSTSELPEEITQRLHKLMQSLNLGFGCIDLVLTPDGKYVFLEVNPSGQWLWLDDQLNLGISNAVADWLVKQ